MRIYKIGSIGYMAFGFISWKWQWNQFMNFLMLKCPFSSSLIRFMIGLPCKQKTISHMKICRNCQKSLTDLTQEILDTSR